MGAPPPHPRWGLRSQTLGNFKIIVHVISTTTLLCWLDDDLRLDQSLGPDLRPRAWALDRQARSSGQISSKYVTKSALSFVVLLLQVRNRLYELLEYVLQRLANDTYQQWYCAYSEFDNHLSHHDHEIERAMESSAEQRFRPISFWIYMPLADVNYQL